MNNRNLKQIPKIKRFNSGGIVNFNIKPADTTINLDKSNYNVDFINSFINDFDPYKLMSRPEVNEIILDDIKEASVPEINSGLLNHNDMGYKNLLGYEKLRFEYIKELENPNMVGYDEKNDRWTSPTLKGYDKNGIGIGLDKYTNTYVKNYLQKHNKDWLTMKEMIDLLNISFNWAEGVLSRNTKGLNMSDIKRVVALGIIYHGHGPKLWKEGNSLHDALFYKSDKEFIDEVTKFYKGNSRSTRHKNFFENLI